MAADGREADSLVEELPSRYVVGIDLGTTNSAVNYVDTREQSWRVRVFPIPQLVAHGQVESRETLPSFHYAATHRESSSGALRLPWHAGHPEHAVGVFAREEGAKSPGRMIASAKSWLCHAGVDRTADLLPWQGAADVERLSPVEVTARYLRHLRDAWNARFPGEPLARQDIVLTLPASFDEVARELTVEAAARAELPRVVLIEEPLAAFYAWVYRHARDWHQLVEPGQKILVCDIGGGTTDFTLIRVRRSEAADAGGPRIQFHRVAVGDHLILGGDNLDLALAGYLESKAAGEGKLLPQQWNVLVCSCRRIKETLLGDDAPERLAVNLAAAGSRVIGGALQIEVTRDEVRQLLVEGFLPRVGLDARPASRRSGFQEFGLPYAPDPAITRYLAAFLTAHREVALEGLAPRDHDPARPDAVLLNGGFFESRLLRERLLEVLRSWFPGPGGQPWSPLILENERRDLAVAQGAAYYGMVRRGQGVRIAANLARSYYIGIESREPLAVCLIPGHAEPGQELTIRNRTFELTIAEPVEFPLYVSSVRLVDQPGDVVPVEAESMTALPPLRTVLKTRRRSERGCVPVELHARLTEIGTMDLWCREPEAGRRWRLQFDVRSATQTDVQALETAAEREGVLDENARQVAHQRIAGVFAPQGSEEPERLMKRLAQELGLARAQWPPSLLRGMWESLMEFEAGRRRSPLHEARWLNLLGYALRPGYGMAVDDWRVAETWRAVHGKLAFPASANEALILWRRLAGGLSRGQQVTVAERLLAQVRALHQHHVGGKRRQADLLVRPPETAEIWRTLGSLELLPVPVKVELGDLLAELIPGRKLQSVRSALVWALGRLGQRAPLYGPLNTVVPREKAQAWLDAMLRAPGREPIEQLAVMQLARRTRDRHRDLEDHWRSEAIEWLNACHAPPRWVELVRDGGRLDSEEQGQILGESLPKGLRLS